MAYISDNEIPLYTSMPGITIKDIEDATALIDAHKGRSFIEKTFVEQSKLSKKNSVYGHVFKGKLKHLPRVTIEEVKAYTSSPFGGETEVFYDISCLRFDSDDEPYFNFIPQQINAHNIFPSAPPLVITVTYTAGYAKNNIPVDLKKATGFLADNLKRTGGTLKWKSRSDFDMNITLADDGIFTTEIRKLIELVRLS